MNEINSAFNELRYAGAIVYPLLCLGIIAVLIVIDRGLWVHETVVTAAPLMGLLGTIMGMMAAFKVIGGSGLVAPTQVTSGVAQALISTALGLLIALPALFGFNFFARMQSRTLD